MFFKSKLDFYSSNLEKYIDCLNSGDLSFIPWIYCVFAENSDKHKLKASQTLNKILKTLSFDDICKVDMQMRQTTSMEWSINWRSLNIKDFITKQMSLEESRAVIVFSSFNPNGHIRQQAVELLGSYESTLSYIILRQNDWVNNVRQSALDSFVKRIKVATDKEILQALPFLEKLRRCERCESSAIFNFFYNEISKNKSKNIFEIGLNNSNIITRKFCIYTLINNPLSNYQILKNHIEKEKDPFLRKLIFQSFLNINVNLEDLSEQFLKDKYPANRIMALKYLYDNNKNIASKKAMHILLDKNAGVRTLAKNILQEMNLNINFHEYYLENLTKNTTCSILGLGEIGSKEDCATIEIYLNDSKISVIRASMISLMRLNTQKYSATITERLLSEQVGIVKTAKLLIEKYHEHNFQRIFEIYQITTNENTKIKCALLLFKATKWHRLIYILLILSSEYESIQSLCTGEIYRWIGSYNRSYVTVTEEQKRKIQELIYLQENRISKQIQNQLLFLVK